MERTKPGQTKIKYQYGTESINQQQQTQQHDKYPQGWINPSIDGCIEIYYGTIAIHNRLTDIWNLASHEKHRCERLIGQSILKHGNGTVCMYPVELSLTNKQTNKQQTIHLCMPSFQTITIHSAMT